MKKGKGNGARHESGKSANVVPLSSKRQAFTRTPWNGFERTDIPNRGGPLLAALFHAANEKGHTLSQMAELLGVTYGYVAQLRNGLRRTEHISARFAETCASYLNVSPFAVKVLARQVRTTDFLEPSKLEVQQIDAGLRRIANDGLLGGLMPSQLFQADIESKAFLLMMYEEATGAELFVHRRVPEVIENALKATALLDAQTQTPRATGSKRRA